MSRDLPPEPATDAERILVDAVIRAVLDWAGLDDKEAEAPGYQTVLVPNRVGAELIGREVLLKLKSRGLGLTIGPPEERKG